MTDRRAVLAVYRVHAQGGPLFHRDLNVLRMGPLTHMQAPHSSKCETFNKRPFYPISALRLNFNPQNIQSRCSGIPVVKTLTRLDPEQNRTLCKGLNAWLMDKKIVGMSPG